MTGRKMRPWNRPNRETRKKIYRNNRESVKRGKGARYGFGLHVSFGHP